MSALRGLSAPEFLSRPGVARVLRLLNEAGEEARVVGGAVRNHLLGLPISDIDICTTALPDEVLARARSNGVHAVPTGYDHGTVTLVVGGVAHEVTTLREDVETDGRRAVVAFGRDFRADALRRDFTMNALSVTASGQLFDYAEGVEDLKARRVRFIGNADSRIREDYLRILRFFRFSAAYGAGALDPEGLAAAIRHRAGLARLSRERVRQEMLKLLVAPEAVEVVAAMAATGILADVLHDEGDIGALRRMAALEAEHVLNADAMRRLAALAIPDAGVIDGMRDLMRLTNREEVRLAQIVPSLPASGGDLYLKERLFSLGSENYRDALLLTAARSGVNTDLVAALHLPHRWQVPPFLVTGADVLALGIARGPEVGRRLAEARQRWFAAGLPEGRDAQLVLLA